MSKAYEYEVRCPHCNVSFPVGTKRCLHCGARTVHGPAARAASGDDALPFLAAMSRDEARPGDVRRPLPIDAPDEDEEQTLARGGLVRAAITGLWILVAIGFSILRACTEK